MFSFIVSNDKIHHLNVGNGLDRSVIYRHRRQRPTSGAPRAALPTAVNFTALQSERSRAFPTNVVLGFLLCRFCIGYLRRDVGKAALMPHASPRQFKSQIFSILAERKCPAVGMTAGQLYTRKAYQNISLCSTVLMPAASRAAAALALSSTRKIMKAPAMRVPRNA